VDEPKYSLVITPKVPSERELREPRVQVAGGGRGFTGTLWRSSTPGARRFEGSSTSAGSWPLATLWRAVEELYADEDMRELQRRKLSQYKRDREAQLYQEVLSVYDSVAFPAEDGGEEG